MSSSSAATTPRALPTQENCSSSELLSRVQQLRAQHDRPFATDQEREALSKALYADLQPLALLIEQMASERGLTSWAMREITPITFHLSYSWGAHPNRTPSGLPLLRNYLNRLEGAVQTLCLHTSTRQSR